MSMLSLLIDYLAVAIAFGLAFRENSIIYY